VRRLLHRSAAAALPLIAAAIGTQAASAALSGASFAVKPVYYDTALRVTKSYFILKSRPGAVLREKVRIVNTGGTTGTAFLYAVDATTGNTSGAVYRSRRSPRNDVGAWLSLARSTVTLAPHTSIVVPLTVTVPAGARPGDHLGGIVAENSALQQSSGHGALQIRIRHLTIAAFEVELPGHLAERVLPTSVRAGGEHGWQYVYVHFKNLSSVLMKPHGSLLIKDARGKRVAFRSFNLDTFVPTTGINYPVLLPKQALVPGRYIATVRIASSHRFVPGYLKTSGLHFDVTRTFGFTVSPSERQRVFSGTPALSSPAHGTSLTTLMEFAMVLIAGVGIGFGVVLVRRRQPTED
jgi:hypothetical protein